jgi:hypothetical protein
MSSIAGVYVDVRPVTGKIADGIKRASAGLTTTSAKPPNGGRAKSTANSRSTFLRRARKLPGGPLLDGQALTPKPAATRPTERPLGSPRNVKPSRGASPASMTAESSAASHNQHRTARVRPLTSPHHDDDG